MTTDLEYTLIERCDRVNFIADVNAHIAAGWSLWGGTLVLMDPASPLEKMIYAQAMTRSQAMNEFAAHVVGRVEEPIREFLSAFPE